MFIKNEHKYADVIILQMNGKYNIEAFRKLSCFNPNGTFTLSSDAFRTNEKAINTQEPPPLYMCARKTVPLSQPTNTSNEVELEPLHNKEMPTTEKPCRCIKTVPIDITEFPDQSDLKLHKKRLRSHSNSSSNLPLAKSPINYHSSSSEEDLSDRDRCLICRWVFPTAMLLEEREAHVNKCLDSQHQGIKDKNNYIKSLENAKSMKKVFLSEMDAEVCPFCYKKLPKCKERHLKSCSNRIINQ